MNLDRILTNEQVGLIDDDNHPAGISRAVINATRIKYPAIDHNNRYISCLDPVCKLIQLITAKNKIQDRHGKNAAQTSESTSVLHLFPPTPDFRCKLGHNRYSKKQSRTLTVGHDIIISAITAQMTGGSSSGYVVGN